MTTEDNSVDEQVKCYQMRTCLSNVLRAMYNIHGRTLNIRLNAVCNQSTQHRSDTHNDKLSLSLSLLQAVYPSGEGSATLTMTNSNCQLTLFILSHLLQDSQSGVIQV